MSKNVKISKMYFFHSPITNDMELCFPIERKTIDDKDYIGVVTEVGGSVFWALESEVLEPHNN